MKARVVETRHPEEHVYQIQVIETSHAEKALIKFMGLLVQTHHPEKCVYLIH